MVVRKRHADVVKILIRIKELYMAKLNVEVFADGADIEEMKDPTYKNKQVDGFTTNPSLMAKAGVTDYKAFAEEAVKEIPDASISLKYFQTI